MAESKKDKKITKDKFLDEIKDFNPGAKIPGYWNLLEDNCVQWAKDVSVGPFWDRAKQELGDWRVEYISKYGGALLTNAAGLADFQGKGKKRIISKLYNKRLEDESVLEKYFDKEGPPVPKLNDLVRTRVVCQYIDGVVFLGDKLFRLAEEMCCSPELNREGRVEGYFAQHLNFRDDVFYRAGGGNSTTNITMEIQIATAMSTNVWETKHSIYEISRENSRPSEDWQWNPQDPEFISNQLGHMIHLADGLLVQLRDAARSNKSKGVKDGF